jgi:hypothetical protein
MSDRQEKTFLDPPQEIGALNYFNSFRIVSGEDRISPPKLAEAVLSITNDEDAKRFYNGYLLWMEMMDALHPERRDTQPRFSNQEIVQLNIGWVFGEGMQQDDVDMWSRVCNARHPAFGTKLPNSPDEAFRIGMELGKNLRKMQNTKEQGWSIGQG